MSLVIEYARLTLLIGGTELTLKPISWKRLTGAPGSKPVG